MVLFFLFPKVHSITHTNGLFGFIFAQPVPSINSSVIIIMSVQYSSTLLLSLIFIIIERLKIVVCQFVIDNACPGERERCSAHILGGAPPSQSLSLTLSWIILDSDSDIEIIIVLDFDIGVGDTALFKKMNI